MHSIIHGLWTLWYSNSWINHPFFKISCFYILLPKLSSFSKSSLQAADETAYICDKRCQRVQLINLTKLLTAGKWLNAVKAAENHIQLSRWQKFAKAVEGVGGWFFILSTQYLGLLFVCSSHSISGSFFGNVWSMSSIS